MTDLTAWIAWLLIGASMQPEQLAEVLDSRGVTAEQVAEEALRRVGVKEGLVACTPGSDADAEERAKIIAKRAIAAQARAQVAGFEKLTYAYNAAMTSRSAGANNGNWLYVSAKLRTREGGEETCVAYVPRPPEKR